MPLNTGTQSSYFRNGQNPHNTKLHCFRVLCHPVQHDRLLTLWLVLQALPPPYESDSSSGAAPANPDDFAFHR